MEPAVSLAIATDIVYLIASFALFYSIGVYKTFAFPYLKVLTKAGLLINIASIATRWLYTGHAPANIYELNVVGAALAVSLYLFIEYRVKELTVLGVVVYPAVTVLLAWGLTLHTGAEALKPEYQSIWLVAHIFAAFLASAFYLLSFACSLIYLGYKLIPERLLNLLPEIIMIEEYNARLITGGVVFQGLMITLGAIWAQEAWGNYWSWDPVETWSLISWLFYGLFLHLYFSLNWRGRFMLSMTAIAFIALVATYWWIPHLPVSNF